MPVQNDDINVGVNIFLLVKLLYDSKVLIMFWKVLVSEVLEGLDFVDLVFFHLMPDEGEVVAVAERSFQILYKIFSALLEMSSCFF